MSEGSAERDPGELTPAVPPAPLTPDRMRASDADREKYVAVLREAYSEGRLLADEYEQRMDAAYRARTYADLVPLLHDLPVKPGQVPLAPAGVTGEPAVRTAGLPVALGTLGQQASHVAIFAETKRQGQWTLPEESTAFALFGSVLLDLTQASVAANQTVLHANAVFGTVVLKVPEGVRVETSGVGVFGAFDGNVDGPPDAPVIRVDGLALFGSFELKRVKPKGLGRKGRKELPS